MVFQDPHAQIVGSTVEEDVAFGPRNLGLSRAEVRQRVEWALQTVGMWELRHRLPFQLSAGQAQRVALAGALAMKPHALVLDEATAMLDPAGRRSILSLLSRLNAEGMTILLITHFPEEALQAQRLIVLHRGSVVADARPADIFNRPTRLMEWGIAPPTTGVISRQVHQVIPCVPPDLLDVGEITQALVRCLSSASFSPALSSMDWLKPNGREMFWETRDLWHVYMAGTPLEVTALKGVHFTASRGATVGLMGTTGSGKSTLMQHLNGLLFPQQGEVWVNGQEIRQWRSRLPLLRRTIAMLFQRAEDQLFERYVGDDVAAGLRSLRLPRKALRERVRWAMEMVGLAFDAYKDRPVYSLSGGEKRKVALAGVLVLKPQGLILDEPTVGLDPTSRQELLGYLKDWRQKTGATFVYSSHSPGEIAEMTEKTVIMREGTIALAGSTREILYNVHTLQSLGVDVPVVVQIVRGMESEGMVLPDRPLTVKELVSALSRWRKGNDHG